MSSIQRKLLFPVETKIRMSINENKMDANSGNFDALQLIQQFENKVFRSNFSDIMAGIQSATMRLVPYRYGVPDTGFVYRKFIYNKQGDITQKYYYSPTGDIEMKENFLYNANGDVLKSEFITPNSILLEKFEYNQKGKPLVYQLSNPLWHLEGKQDKREIYFFDAQGRKIKKESYGFLGTLEFITHYLYEGNAKKYKFRHVTNPDGSLVMTLMYLSKKESQLTDLYSFALTPNEVKELLKSNKTWEKESLSSSHWEYDADGNAIGFRSEVKEQLFHLKNQSAEFGVPREGRVMTRRFKSKFDQIKGKGRLFLTETTEYWPKFDEPKEVKTYSYFDENGKQIYPPVQK